MVFTQLTQQAERLKRSHIRANLYETWLQSTSFKSGWARSGGMSRIVLVADARVSLLSKTTSVSGCVHIGGMRVTSAK